MAKKAILDVLENTIGKYVRNLDAESLNVAVWSGSIELNSLELDVDAVNAELDRQAAEAPNLALPFKVVDGKFTSFEVEVPWARITSRPVVLRAKGLQVLVEPYDRSSQFKGLKSKKKSEKKAKKMTEARAQSLKLANENRLRSNAVRKLTELDVEEDDEGAKGEKSKSSFGGRLVRRIIENLQVEVQDVHVSLQSCGSSAGIVLQSLSLATTDKNGKRTFVDRKANEKDPTSSFLYKALQIKGFGVYLNNEVQGHTRPVTVTEGKVLNKVSPGQHSYILSPLSFEAKLRQSDSLECIDFPKYLVSSELSQLSILLTRNQLELGNKIALTVQPSRNVARPLFPQYRPLYSISKESAKDWWVYAFRCVSRLNGKRSWVEFFLAFQKRKRYIPLFKRHSHHVLCSWIDPLTHSEQEEMEGIESDRTISNAGLMTWRNIADAQVDRERKKDEAVKSRPNSTKNAKTSILSSFFSTSSDKRNTSADKRSFEEPPITLTPEEVQELEAISLEQAAEVDLSNDSRLCDLQFVLGSLKVDLISHGMRPIASLDMGKVTTNFNAHANGSLVFDFRLSSLEVHDKATTRSLFPIIIRSLQSSSRKDKLSTSYQDAFRFQLSTSNTGDQKVLLQIVAFQMVASSLLLIEVKRFFSMSKSPTSPKLSLGGNPMLAQSLSGTVDLFYDAGEGIDASGTFPIVDDTTTVAAAAKARVSEQLSSALVDAWKSKALTKSTWTIDCDIHAPIIVLPENCTDVTANVLVFDLGRLALKYGKIAPSVKVEEWFSKQPKRSNMDTLVDYGSLTINNLKFFSGKASEVKDLNWSNNSERIQESYQAAKSTIIEPVTVNLKFGIESTTAEEGPRMCFFGILPVVCLRISPNQVSKVFSVVDAWKIVIEELTGVENTPGGVTIIEEVERSSERIPTVSSDHPITFRATQVEESKKSGPSKKLPQQAMESFAMLHLSMALQRLSIHALSDSGDGMEAHLVSVSASLSSMIDGTLCASLRMGWFWILDRLEYDFPRQQRLVAHSNLPHSAASFSQNGYDILGDLGRQGVFDEGFLGSSDLADITLKSFGGNNNIQTSDPVAWQVGMGSRSVAQTAVDAKFTSLFIHWNPRAVKSITSMKAKIFALIEENYASRISNIESDLRSPSSTKSQRVPSRLKRVAHKNNEDGISLGSSTGQVLILNAEMESLEISLNSARDDMPLFLMAMSGTKVSFASSKDEDENMKASLVLGDVRIETPTNCGTHPSYSTLLGLAPNQNTSLLSVNYCMGTKSIQTLSLDNIDVSGCEACAQVELSPMRLVHIHSQLFTLIEYITEGILGALFAKAATSAAEAALEIANSVTGGKVFAIKGTGVELILPKAAYSPQHLCLYVGDLDVFYNALPEPPGGAKARLSLRDVSLRGGTNEPMVKTPIRMSVDVDLPPIDVGSEEDKTMRVDVDISQASFLLSKSQYEQVLGTLEFNIGEKDPFLRNEQIVPVKSDTFEEEDIVPEAHFGEGKSSSREVIDLTHAGVKAVENIRRIDINFIVEVLSIELCGRDTSDPIICMAAVKTCIAMRIIPDEERSMYDITLHNLVCDDRRLQSIDRPFRSLICQVHEEISDDNESPGDVFQLSYVKYLNGSSEVDFKIGSPQFVVIPDAIAAVLNFIRIETKTTEALEAYFQKRKEKKELNNQGISLQFDEREGSVEASFVSSDVENMVVSIMTSNCSFVLIDSGNQSCVLDDASSISASQITSQKTSNQVTETIVLQGAFEAEVLLVKEKHSGRTIKTDLQAHGDGMQIYSAHGGVIKSPLQIVEPARFSVFYVSKAPDENSRSVDIRTVTLSPVEVIFSMQNAALITAIASSFSESFKDAKHVETIVALSDEEVKRIEFLETALETNDNGAENDTLALSRRSSSVDGSLLSESAASPIVNFLSAHVRVTMPETRVTFINDLQGLDEALFRVTVRNLVAGFEMKDGVSDVGSTKQLTFDSNINTSIMADYFDSSTNLWRSLLVKPWEITFAAARGISKRFKTDRLSTTIDLESFPCHISFSEHFLASLGAANRTWSIYSLAVEKGATKQDKMCSNDRTSTKSMATNAARSLITALPYAVENHAGIDVQFSLDSGESDSRICSSGSVQYFRFEPPSGDGFGGQRLYGQDVSQLKTVTLFICDKKIELDDLDTAISSPRSAHNLGDGRIVIIHVVKEGKTTVIHISSQVDIQNCTSVPFLISVANGNDCFEIGTCPGKSKARKQDSQFRRSSLMKNGGATPVPSQNFGIPVDLLNFRSLVEGTGSGDLLLAIQPCLPQTDNVSSTRETLCGSIIIPIRHIIQGASKNGILEKFDVVCQPQGSPRSSYDPFVLQVCLKSHLVNGAFAFLEVFLEPRAVLTNKMPVSLFCRTPMPHTFSRDERQFETGLTDIGVKDSHEITHKLRPNDFLEIFTPGPSIAITVKCAEDPIGGGTTGWMEGGWIDLPLVPEFRLPEPLKCVFPFDRDKSIYSRGRTAIGGSEFFFAEDNEALSEVLLERERQLGHNSPKESDPSEQSNSGQELSFTPDDYNRKFLLTVCNYAVDHTGGVLFEQITEEESRSNSRGGFAAEIEASQSFRKPLAQQIVKPFSAFASLKYGRRISLLPDSNAPLRLLHLTMDGDDGIRRTLPFRIADLSITEGGIESTPIRWEDNSPSGYFAYRKLTGSYQSEIHVIPEFIVFNGSKTARVLLKQHYGTEIIIEPRKTAPFTSVKNIGLVLSIDFIDIGGRTVLVPCDALGLRICQLKALDGSTLGSIAVQTVIGAADSCFVVKLGEIKFGASVKAETTQSSSSSLFSNDFFRFRVRWSELQLTLNEGHSIDPNVDKPIIETALDQISKGIQPIEKVRSPLARLKSEKETWTEARKRHNLEEEGPVEGGGQREVATISFLRFTVDYQRIFKDSKPDSKEGSNNSSDLSPERNQISIIIYNVRMLDCTPNTPYPIVFDCRSANSFVDLCVRIRGPINADLVKVDLFDLNLAYGNGNSERISVETHEDFVWKLLDIANSILVAATELAGKNLELEWDEQHGGFVVSVADTSTDFSSIENTNTNEYKPPNSSRLYAIHTARVSPLSLLVSFKRQPQTSRYKRLRGVRGAKLMNYFTRRLKFKIDKAEFQFPRYIVKNTKGPPDRLVELIKAYYISKLKLNIVTLLTAVSIQDWKHLAARLDGDDVYQEGDIARAGGNIVGSSAGYVLKNVGKGISTGVSALTGSIGNEIENATGKVGARAVGAGVNSVISGLGDGVGNTVQGVGTGAGEVMKGAGKGIGHVVGGVTGGAILIGKGVGKGFKGDGKALVSGFRDGALSVGSGLGEGVGSVVTGAADGVLTAGSGLFNGVKSIGMGMGGVFSGKKAKAKGKKLPKR